MKPLTTAELHRAAQESAELEALAILIMDAVLLLRRHMTQPPARNGKIITIDTGGG